MRVHIIAFLHSSKLLTWGPKPVTKRVAQGHSGEQATQEGGCVNFWEKCSV